VTWRTLGLGLLQGGAGAKGEFENRLQSMIEETKTSPKLIILLIHEAHALIGAGGVLLYGHTGIAVAIGEAKTWSQFLSHRVKCSTAWLEEVRR